MWRVWSFKRLLLKLKVRRFSEKHFSSGMTGFWSVSDDDHHLQVGYDFPCFFSWKFLRVQYSEQQLKCERPFQFCHGFLENHFNCSRVCFKCYSAWVQTSFCGVSAPVFVAHLQISRSPWCIVEHSVPIFCVNPLTIAEGKKAALSNWFNNYLVKCRFKYRDLPSLSQVLEEGHWFFAWGLKSGYHHIDICSEHQAFLGFPWSIDGALNRGITTWISV